MQAQIIDASNYFDASNYYYEAKGYDIRVKEYVPPPDEMSADDFENLE